MINGLPEKLKGLRQNCMLSQRDIARRLDVSASIISAYETGERTPSVENILALAAMYGCSVDYLLGCERIRHSIRLNVDGLSERQIYILSELIDSMREKNN